MTAATRESTVPIEHDTRALAHRNAHECCLRLDRTTPRTRPTGNVARVTQDETSESQLIAR